MSNESKKVFTKSYFKEITESFFENRFTNLGYLPRWIIICIDIVILIFASFLTYYIISNLTLRFYDTYSLSTRYLIIIVSNVLCFIAFRTYAGIIRYSTFIDALRLLLSTFSAFIILVVLNYVHYFVTGNKIYLFPALFIHFVISYLLLLAFRISVKFLFENYLFIANQETLTKVVIYGASSADVALANALNLEVPKRYQLVGFIDQKKSKLKKEVLGVPIVQKKKNVAAVLRMLKADAIIISDKSLSKEAKFDLVEDCLEHNYKILTVPSITDWNENKNISKRIKNFQIEDLLERSPIILDDKNIAKQIKEKVIFITGAAGSIGSEIVYQILNFQPQKIVLIDQAETPLYQLTLQLQKITKKTEIIPIVADIKDKVILHHLFENYLPNVIYHAAAYKHVPLMEENPYQALKTNVLGTMNLADLSLQFEVDRFVMVSTDKAVNPSNIMGASKRIAEKYVQSLYFNNRESHPFCTKFITTRFGNVLGSNGSVVPLFTRQIEEGGPVTITHPDIIRYFMTIPEACQLVLEAGAMGSGGEIYIFDMGNPVKIIDLAKKMIRLAGFVPDKDIAIKVVGLRPGEKLYEELLNDNAKTLATHHNKIMIAIEEGEKNFDVLKKEINELLNTIEHLKVEEAVTIMKKIVPEFKSMNSVFEALD